MAATFSRQFDSFHFSLVILLSQMCNWSYNREHEIQKRTKVEKNKSSECFLCMQQTTMKENKKSLKCSFICANEAVLLLREQRSIYFEHEEVTSRGRRAKKEVR